MTVNIVLSGNFEWTDDDLNLLADSGRNKIFQLHNEEAALQIPPADVDAVICNWFFKYHPLEEFTRLSFVQLLSAGFNGIDPIAVQNMGIALFCARDVYSIPISEFVVSRLLSYYKSETYFVRKQKRHEWAKLRTIGELYGKKVLIVGTGSIGNEVAKRIRAFTDEVYGCNRTIRVFPSFKEIFPLTKLQTVIFDFDIIILTIALTESTKHLLNSEMFSVMKKTAILVNVSRGEIVDERALIDALVSGSIAGAILDVFEEEPLQKESPLWDMDNVLISPHNSFASDNNYDRLRSVIFRNFNAWESKYGQK